MAIHSSLFQSDEVMYKANRLFPSERPLDPVIGYLCQTFRPLTFSLCIISRLDVTHIFNKILHLVLTMHGNWTGKYIFSEVTSLKNCKVFLFPVFWLSDCHFHSVNSQDENSLTKNLHIDQLYCCKYTTLLWCFSLHLNLYFVGLLS